MDAPFIQIKIDKLDSTHLACLLHLLESHLLISRVSKNQHCILALCWCHHILLLLLPPRQASPSWQNLGCPRHHDLIIDCPIWSRCLASAAVPLDGPVDSWGTRLTCSRSWHLQSLLYQWYINPWWYCQHCQLVCCWLAPHFNINLIDPNFTLIGINCRMLAHWFALFVFAVWFQHIAHTIWFRCLGSASRYFVLLFGFSIHILACACI